MSKATKDNPIAEKTIKFAIEIVKMVDEMPKTPAGFAIGGQLIRSGTSIGANTQEAQRAHSKKDFKNCLRIALKEAVETRYWIFVSEKSGLLKNSKLSEDIEEIIKILSVIIKNCKT